MGVKSVHAGKEDVGFWGRFCCGTSNPSNPIHRYYDFEFVFEAEHYRKL
jgi:hypothetical protein